MERLNAAAQLRVLTGKRGSEPLRAAQTSRVAHSCYMHNIQLNTLINILNESARPAPPRGAARAARDFALYLDQLSDETQEELTDLRIFHFLVEADQCCGPLSAANLPDQASFSLQVSSVGSAPLALQHLHASRCTVTSV